MQPGYRKVTVLQLLSHTGGFPFSPSMPMDQITARGRNGVDRRYGYVKAAIVDPPQAAPGTKVIYSGGPVVVMACISSGRPRRPMSSSCRTGCSGRSA